MPFRKGRSGNIVTRFKRGRSGNPAGRPVGLTRYIREITGEGAELVNFILAVFRADELQIANGKARASQRNKIDLRDRIAAATWLADRAFGRPGQVLDDAPPEMPIGLTNPHLVVPPEFGQRQSIHKRLLDRVDVTCKPFDHGSHGLLPVLEPALRVGRASKTDGLHEICS